MPDHGTDTTEMECPECGAPNEYTVLVWENKEDADLGLSPDYVGCKKCHTMTEYGK